MEIKRYKLEAIKMNTQRLFDTAHLDSFAKEWKAQSKNNKVLGYYCSHLPEEILYAADVLPYRIRGTGITSDSNAESYLSPFSCSFCRGCFEQFLDGRTTSAISSMPRAYMTRRRWTCTAASCWI